MQNQLEISLKKNIWDAEGELIKKKAKLYFGINIDKITTINIITIDANLTNKQFEKIRKDIFTNPVTQQSSFLPLKIKFDWTIWVGLKPGVRDTQASTAKEAIEDVLKIRLDKNDAIYTSKRYCFKSNSLTFDNATTIAKELLANEIIQKSKIISKENWDKKIGIGINIPKVILNTKPKIDIISIDSDNDLFEISLNRNLALNKNDIPIIRKYFLNANVVNSRKKVGLNKPTDLEIEYIAQARSDHCNHNTFKGLFNYKENKTSPAKNIDNLFKTFIEKPTLFLKSKNPDIISVLWDNAGVGRFDENYYYTITGETHNSPSNMEAYGGSITGIVGVYRDPMGTGKGSKLIMGSYGFCVGNLDYNQNLKPHLTPQRLLDGIIEGVRDGGNKSGIPTTFGKLLFDKSYLGKCLVFVTAVGIMPAKINNKPSEQKKPKPDDFVVMCGGRVGKDGIHGVTASSEIYSETTPSSHVQIGDPYTQKKMHDFLLEARDNDLISFITDNGGGGLSSSVGESAEIAGGCQIQLETVPLKYDGLQPWEIWISESQERMTVAVSSLNIEEFLKLSKLHSVESTIIGKYTNSGKLHITYKGKTCAYVDIDFLNSGFSQWKFDATWSSPEERGLFEPVLSEPINYTNLLLDLLNRPNISSTQWITRQYDHEVQGSSIIKPLVGVNRDMNSDASVIRPILHSKKGIAFSQALIPNYSSIDAYHMTSSTIDEAFRRVLAVGANVTSIGGVDNYCWPNIFFDSVNNPDGKFKAAQLVRSCQSLKDTCLSYEIPLLSGKDSMYVDGNLKGAYGETHKVSALETLQFSTIGIVDDIEKCLTMEPKFADDLIYVIGNTFDELGGSEYYEHLDYTGINVPKVNFDINKKVYKALHKSIGEELIASCHGIYRGGVCVHLALMSIGSNLGLNVNLKNVPLRDKLSNDKILFSESPGRFLLTVNSKNKENIDKLENNFKNLPLAKIGYVLKTNDFIINGINSEKLIATNTCKLKESWKKRFGNLI